MDVFAKESTEQEIQGPGWWDDVAVIKSDGACAQICFLTANNFKAKSGEKSQRIHITTFLNRKPGGAR